MNRFRELVERLYIAHTEFQRVWKAYRPYCMTTKEPQEVTDARNKFWAALNALFGKLQPFEQPFLAGDPKAIEAVLEFAEVDIPAFRCGYAKQRYFRKLKSLPLNKTQEARLRHLAYNLCRGPNYGRELADMARLMIRLADAPLIRELQSLAGSSDGLVRLKSRRMLDVILHHREDLRDDVKRHVPS
jgi:hypothetical protein